jgi:hypothetical protein
MSVDGKNENSESSYIYVSCLENVLKAPKTSTLSQFVKTKFEVLEQNSR